jgi:hypothetical protein
VPVAVDQLTTELALTGIPWDKARWDRFVRDLTPAEQRLEVQMLVDSAEPPPPNAWAAALKVLLAVLGTAGAIGADLSGIGAGIAAIQTIAKI